VDANNQLSTLTLMVDADNIMLASTLVDANTIIQKFIKKIKKKK
jgi:hypothetical protein